MRFLAILALVLGTSAQAATTRTVGADSLEGSVAEQNLVKNSQCEPGLGKSFWTASGGSLSTTTTASQIGRGSQSCTFDGSAANQTVTGTLVTVSGGLLGRVGEASGLFQCQTGTCTHELHTWDGTTDSTLGSLLVTGTLFQRKAFNFTLPSASSARLALRIKAIAANEPMLGFDDMYLGVTQGTLVAGAVTSQSSGSERIERASFGTTATHTPCTASPCSYVAQSGSWVSSVARTAQGKYTVNIAAGVFSAAPSCTCRGYASGNNLWCQGGASADTSTGVYLEIINTTPAAADAFVDVICMGQR